MSTRRHQRTLYFADGTARRVSLAAYLVAKRACSVGTVDYGWLALEAHEIPAAIRLAELGYVEMQSRTDPREPDEGARKARMSVRWKPGVARPRFKPASTCASVFIQGQSVRVSAAQRVFLERLAAGARMRTPHKYDKFGVMARSLERRGIVTIDWTDGVGEISLAVPSDIPRPPPPIPVGQAVLAHVMVCGPIGYEELVDMLRADRPGMRRIVFANAVGAAVNAGSIHYVRIEGRMCLKIGPSVPAGTNVT